MTSSNPLVELNSFLSACRKSYDKCIDFVKHTDSINGITATTRLHHLKFDGNGKPMISALAETLYEHIIEYCISTQNRPSPLTPKDATKLTREARNLFIHPESTEDDPDQTGEAGEALLYFLLESVLGVPQIVAKMELKTNKNDEVKGSDGIHMCWNESEQLVDLYFGEAKLYQNMDAAITSMLKSVASFHEKNMCRHEFKLATKHFKYANPRVQEAVKDLLGSGVPSGGVRINHACLVGYNWDEYKNSTLLPISQLTSEFREKYKIDSPRIHKSLQSKFDKFERKHLRFEIFFLPFPTVQEFRNAFNAALD
ncbi:MAG: DUF1837 domain-containing protein [Gallionella sp.]|nr:DUF1837 domain-containing protein [Gallionella sp.]MDD4958815.1 DUF1837 domain-containing protein [Gallionella sp.]